MQSKARHILIIDDVLKNLEVTGKILKDEGYHISLAMDGKQALSQLEHLIPDLILLDVMMPNINGYDLCRILKQDDKLLDIPVIFLTAKIETEDLAEGFKAGGVDYITKPFNSDELKIRVKNHIELAYSRNKIIELNNTRDKLYSIIAHDIRSPFSGISMTISALASGHLDPLGPDFKEMINYLDKTTKETSSLLENLLDWTRMQSESGDFPVARQNIHPLIHTCIELFMDQAAKKEISISNEVAVDHEAFFNEVTMQSVFRNLVFNAIKFTPIGGNIHINSKIQQEYLQINFADNGVGISEDVVNKIFKNKEHYTSRGTNKEEGSGLGTFLIQDFTEKNHGKLIVKSIVDEGTEIQVFLPLKNMDK